MRFVDAKHDGLRPADPPAMRVAAKEDDRVEDERWWQAFFKAADLIRGDMLHAPQDDHGARACAAFADEAIKEAKARGRV